MEEFSSGEEHDQDSILVLYVENPKDSIRKLLELISEFSKAAEYKINNTEITCISIY